MGENDFNKMNILEWGVGMMIKGTELEKRCYVIKGWRDIIYNGANIAADFNRRQEQKKKKKKTNATQHVKS